MLTFLFVIFVMFSALVFTKVAFLSEKALKDAARRTKSDISLATHIAVYAWSMIGAITWPIWIMPMGLVYAMRNWRMTVNTKSRIAGLFREAVFYHEKRKDGYGLENVAGTLFRGIVWERENMNDFQFQRQLERAAELVESWYKKS